MGEPMEGLLIVAHMSCCSRAALLQSIELPFCAENSLCNSLVRSSCPVVRSTIGQPCHTPWPSAWVLLSKIAVKRLVAAMWHYLHPLQSVLLLLARQFCLVYLFHG